ncbi:MAG TPA: type II toxin-antitoxin system VapC family toxin [Rhizomicrobium sp.]|nr:type II toxin-antitoxin system VapC family toxin [Rhizomicrobium sp.]
MSATLLLDTHIALWLDSGNASLKSATRQKIDECWRDGGIILLSAVSAWEIALLEDLDRIALDLPVADWVARFLNRPGFAPAPLSPEAAGRAYDMKPFAHRDPVDRLLMATAMELHCPLVSYDRNIAQFAKRHGRQFGFAIVV